jgi:putative peptide zinc metalloprotease protein
MRRLTYLLATAALAVGFATGTPAALADSGGGNSAIAINTKDGASVFKLAFAIREVAGDVVDSTNAAVAYSSCNDCQTVAIAIDIVFVIGNPSVVTPTNIALAVNENCTSCQTLALAYQFIIGVSGPVHFTSEGRREIAQIRRELEALRHSNLSILEIKARADALIARLKNVLRTQLVQSGKSGEAHQKTHETAATNNPANGPPQTTATDTTETNTIPQDTSTETQTTPTDTTPTDTTTTSTGP